MPSTLEESFKSSMSSVCRNLRIQRHPVCFFKLLLTRHTESLRMNGPHTAQCAWRLPICLRLAIRLCNVLLELGRAFIWDRSWVFCTSRGFSIVLRSRAFRDV